MNLTTQRTLRIASTIAFALALLLVLLVDPADREAIEVCVYGGLALLAASFIP